MSNLHSSSLLLTSSLRGACNYPHFTGGDTEACDFPRVTQGGRGPAQHIKPAELPDRPKESASDSPTFGNKHIWA